MKRRVIHCSEMAAYLCENLTEGLNTARCRALKRHLAQCPNCTAYLDSLRKTVYLYKAHSNPRLRGQARKKLHSVLKIR